MIRLWFVLIPFLFVSPIHAADPPFIPLFAGGAGPADAEWAKIGSADDYTFYANPSTIRHKGPLVQMWVLFEYKRINTVAGKTLVSMKQQMEFDCEGEKSRYLESHEYSSHMGAGKPMYSDSTRRSEWTTFHTGSVIHTEWKYACGKWVKIGGSDIHTEYMNLQSVHREGTLVKMWGLRDFKAIQKWGDLTFLSNKSQWEFNCLTRQYRLLGNNWYSGQMGNGEMVKSSTIDADKWELVSSGDWSQNQWSIACGEQQ
ncbi:MAG: hypothetical protein Q8L77_09550 [Nitrospirota bacterium]|nr:hypothetical protein [Nitrospirota bacterium]